ncbi:MAG: helix-turn-helix domain-containing protein [Bacteroidia bacterium]
MLQEVDISALESNFAKMQAKVDAMYEILMQKSAGEITIAGYISDERVQKLLHVSKSTLYKMRRDGRLGATTFSGKDIYYKLSDIEELLKKNDNK